MSHHADSSDQGGNVRCFSGEAEDKEYRRWKLWLVNKFATLDKLPIEARGSHFFTLLKAKGLETVEHLEHQRQVERTLCWSCWTGVFLSKMTPMSLPRCWRKCSASITRRVKVFDSGVAVPQKCLTSMSAKAMWRCQKKPEASCCWNGVASMRNSRP